MSELANNLEKLLRARGEAATTAAKNAGMSHTTIADIIAGKVDSPRFSTIKRIADYFGVSPFELVRPSSANVSIDDEANRLLASFRTLSVRDKALVIALVERLSGLAA